MSAVARPSRWIAALAACLVLGLAGAAPARQSFGAPACDALDVRIIALLEDHDETLDLSRDKLEEATRAMARAHDICAAGHQREAAALFERLFTVGLLAAH